MNSLKVIAAAAALVAVSSPAYAVTIQTTFAPGSSVTGAPVFQSFTTSNPNGTPFMAGSNTQPANSGNPVESSSGTVNYYQGDVGGQAVGPVVTPGTGSFISILNGSYSVAFSGVQVFSFVFGGLDSYNSVTLNFANSLAQTLTGTQICGIANAGCALGSTGRVTYDLGGTDILTGVTFASASPAFEIDEMAAAVPEPTTWALMILGFGMIGSALRRRRRTQVRFNFA